MSLQFTLDELTTPAISPSYFSSEEDMDVDVQSVDATGYVSDNSDIEVIACYGQIPIPPQGGVAGRQMTTKLSDYTDSDFPAFPWEDFENIMQLTESRTDPLNSGAGPNGAVQTDSPPIKHCGE